MPIDLEWDLELQHKHGAAERMCGIDVYHDFDWDEHFSDHRVQFRNGKVLAKHTIDACPDDKVPAILLTDREDVTEGLRHTDEDFVVVVNLPRYLEHADADAAMSYWALGMGPEIAALGQLAPLAEAQPEAFQALIQANLDAEVVHTWANADPENMTALRAIATPDNPNLGTPDPSDIVEALGRLDGVDPSLVAAIAEKLNSDTSPESRLELINALADDREGRRDIGDVFGDRIGGRLSDARASVDEYEALIGDPGSTETTVQQFLEQNIWILGLNYSELRPRLEIPRGTVDFILERFDGFHDLLELKSPQDSIITAPEGATRRPSASQFSLSSALGQALAQIHAYREVLRRDNVTEELYGLRNAHDPHLKVVIGRASSLPTTSQPVLRELNKSLHHVEVIPYDVLGRQASAVLDNIESLITAEPTE